MNKEVLKIIIKVLIYALGLIGSALGITALTSCSSSRAIVLSFYVRSGNSVFVIQNV